MATLYNRATPSQRRLLRIIEGAVKNACDAHPQKQVDARFARSISKRAAGTISAQWPELLAAKEPPCRATGGSFATPSPSPAQPSQRAKRGAAHSSSRTPPSALKKIHTRLGLMAGWARKAGHDARAAAFADALRVVASVQAEQAQR